MEGPKFGENEMNQTAKEDLPPASVSEATVERARNLEKEMLARSARKKTVATNDEKFGEADVQEESVPSLPYLERDDDELVRDPKDDKWVMKKYQD